MRKVAKQVKYRGATYQIVAQPGNCRLAFDPDKYRYDEPPPGEPSEEEEHRDPDYYEEGVLVKPKHAPRDPSYEF